jgi:hypothetical protein
MDNFLCIGFIILFFILVYYFERTNKSSTIIVLSLGFLLTIGFYINGTYKNFIILIIGSLFNFLFVYLFVVVVRNNKRNQNK